MMNKQTYSKKPFKVPKKKQSAKEIELQDKVALLTETLKRSQADFVNFKNRVEKDNEGFVKDSNASLLESIIPQYDQLSKACDTIPESLKTDKWVEGMCQIVRMMEKQLTDLGVENIKTVGEKYHPEFHEAVMRGEGPEKDIILEEFEAGYLFHDKVLRPAKVKVCTEVE